MNFVNTQIEENCIFPEDENSFEYVDRFILESCGYDVDSPKGRMIFENSVAEEESDKIFTIDTYRSYNIDDTVNEILKDEIFDNYWHTKIYDLLEDDRDKLLLEQWTPEFIGEEVRKFLGKLKKLEVFYYIDFFRDILSKSDNDDTMALIDFNDKDFEKIPKVMRLY